MTDIMTSASPEPTIVDDHYVIVTSDSHVGPRLVEDLRSYCEESLRSEYDEWVRSLANHSGFDLATAYDSHPREFRDGIRWNAQTLGHHDVHQRLRDMNADGVAAEVVFHGSQNLEPLPFDAANFFGNGTAPPDFDLAAAGKHIFNRWLADFCSVESARHAGLAQVPMWDIDASTREVEWAAEAGLKGVNFPAADAPGVARLDAPEFDRFYAACADLSMPLTTHLSPITPIYRYLDGPGYGREMAVLDAAWWARRSIWIMTFSGVFRRHPNLRLVITEVPGNWYQDMLEQMDSIFYSGPLGNVRSYLDRPPSEYVKSNVWIGASFPARVEAVAAVQGHYDDRIMWGSDYPHVEGTWQYPEDENEPGAMPMTKQAISTTFGGLPADAVANMLGHSAVECYGLDINALQSVATRVGAPTRADLSQPPSEQGDRPRPRNASVSWAFRSHGPWS